MNGIRIPETNGFNSMEADGVEQDNTDDDLDDEALFCRSREYTY